MPPTGWILVLVLIIGSVGCGKPPPSPIEGLPSRDGLALDPERVPKGPATVSRQGEQVSLREILVAYIGAADLQRRVKLNRDQARVRAAALLELARSQDQDFAELAKRFSDDSSKAAEGGALGVIAPGQLHPDLEAAALALGLFEVSGVIESPRGFHILYRCPPFEAQAAEIVVSYTGAQRYTPRTARTKDEAHALANAILARLKDGAFFEEEATAFSDGENFEKGGIVPIFSKGSRHTQFEQIVWNLPAGGVSEVIETPTGFHIVKRLPVERIQVRRITIVYRAQDAVDPTAARSFEEARLLAEEVFKRASQPGADFAALASEFSDGVEKTRGGLMEPFGRGLGNYAVERAAFALVPGQTSGVIDTGKWFEIVKRLR